MLGIHHNGGRILSAGSEGPGQLPGLLLLNIPVRGCSSTLDTGSPAYSPCSRTTSSVRLGFGFSQPGWRKAGCEGWPGQP